MSHIPIIFQNRDKKTFLEAAPQSDLFIAAVGYEPRSVHLLNILNNPNQRSNSKQGICFFHDYLSYPISEKLYAQCKEGFSRYCIGNRLDYPPVFREICGWIDSIVQKDRRREYVVDIDYSSMPRAWYCRLVKDLALRYTGKYQFRFWYSEGEYSDGRTDGYPTAGIDQFILFSGRASIDSLKHRAHLIGLGYDSVRADGIRSVLDPSYLVACFSYNPDKPEIKNRILRENSLFLDGCAHSVGLPISDFSLMLAKLIEYARNMSRMGDLIVVADGPKPLVLAMSMLDNQLEKSAISCFHVTGTANTAIEIMPTGEIFGLSFFGTKGN